MANPICYFSKMPPVRTMHVKCLDFGLQLARVDALHCVVPPHDKPVSATIFSKLLSTFVESGVTSFV